MKSKHYTIAAIAAAFLAVVSFKLYALVPSVAPVGDIGAQVAGFNAERYSRDVAYLASDDMKGRATGSPELEKAAGYIAQEFQKAGLLPGGANRSWFQPFEVTSVFPGGPKSEFAIDGQALEEGKDFIALSFSGNADFESGVVFAGYGITAPDLKWDDYADVDVKGKVVVVLEHEPQETSASSPFNGTAMTAHASLISKASNARQHGARGIVVVRDVNNHPGDPDTVGLTSRERVDVGIAAVQMRQAQIAGVLEKAGKSLATLQREMDTAFKPQSFEVPNERFHVGTKINRVKKTVRNVVAAVRGTDSELRNEWVVVGAHYDHLGLGDENSLAPSELGQVHHGADDNASGTAGIMELARVAATNRGAFGRSVLFIAFAGEEIGLLGSQYFADHPSVHGRIVSMINLDMIGRVRDNRVLVSGVGTSAGFKEAVEKAGEASGLKLATSEAGNSASDHLSFINRRIPALFFFSGLHEDYHRPSDTADKIDAASAVKVLDVAYRMITGISGAREKPDYIPLSLSPGGSNSASGYPIYFGSRPDMSDNNRGILMTAVNAGSPAEKAGIRAGDLIVEFGGRSVQNIYEYDGAMKLHQPGDVVEIVLRRGKETVKTKATLEARR